MAKIVVTVSLKQGVLDPQGTAVNKALEQLGFKGIEGVRIGKTITLDVDDAQKPDDATIKQMCEQLLANTVIESYAYSYVD